MRREVLQRFLTNTDETGRFIVKSSVTGITYFVEPLYKGKTATWGDINPATKQLEGNYGSKNTGAVKERDSLLKEENGFVNIGYFKGSPFGEIDRRDKEHAKNRIEINKSTQKDCAMEKIADITVSGNSNIVSQLKEIFAK